MATVICGTNQSTSDNFNGKTIAEIKTQHAQVFNIPEECTVLLNDEETEDLGQHLRAEDTVEFVKKSGKKGV